MSPIRIILVFVALSILGLCFIPLLNVDLQPSYDAPKIWVQYAITNASPETIEQEATAPLENILSQISDIKQIQSSSNYNEGSITLTFDKSANMDMKRFEVSAMIRQMYPKLSPHMTYPAISLGQDSRNSAPLLMYHVLAPFSPFQIKEKLQDVMLPPILQLDGIAQVDITGAQEMQVEIHGDRHQLEKYSISNQDILNTISNHSSSQYLGMASNSFGQYYFVQLTSEVNSISDLENLIIQTLSDHNSHQTIQLKDVSEIFISDQEPTSHFRINGLNAVRMLVKSDESLNKITLANQIKEIVHRHQLLLPEGFEVHLDFDETEYIQTELDKIYYRTGLSALILLLFILIIYRSWKYLLVLFSGILINLCMTIGLVYCLEIKVHLYTLAGLAVSFGLIMDNAIVMLDHLNKHQNNKIFVALLAASLTTMASLMILFLLPEEDKKNLVEFSAIISVNLMVSLVVAYWFTPSIYQLMSGKNTVNQ